MDCDTLLCAPDGPSSPFGDPYLLIIDSVRLGTIILAAVVVCLSVVAMRRLDNPQGTRFLSLAVFALVACLTEIDHFGDYASYRLLLNVVACALGVYGTWHYLHDRDRVGG